MGHSGRWVGHKKRKGRAWDIGKGLEHRDRDLIVGNTDILGRTWEKEKMYSMD